MSSALLNAHIEYGQPCGDDADFDQVAEWAGNLLLDLLGPDKVEDHSSKWIILTAILESRGLKYPISKGLTKT
jgi:hypothetical protein